MDVTTTVGHVVYFSAAHHLAGADPAHREAGMHGHRYRVEILSGDPRFDRWVEIENWVRMYLADRNLDDQLDFPSSPAAIAGYLCQVFANYDPRLASVTVTADDRDTGRAEVHW